MICETLVQTFVFTTQPKTSAPPRPGSETRNSDTPTTSARMSSLILGAVVALLRTAVERLWFTLMNRACRDTYKNRTPKGSPFSAASPAGRLGHLSSGAAAEPRIGHCTPECPSTLGLRISFVICHSSFVIGQQVHGPQCSPNANGALHEN